MKTLLIGCTGKAGSEVMKRLIEQGVSVRCMTHSPEKVKTLPSIVEGYVADLDDGKRLPAAFDNVDNFFLAIPVSRNETLQGLAAVDAARNAGIKKIVYLSVHMPEGSEVIPHFASKVPIENAIKESGIAYTILRPNNFYQNDLALVETIMSYGIYPEPFGKVGVNRVDVRDVADCAANALMKPDFSGETISIHGPDRLTGSEIARIYSLYAGRVIQYRGNDLDAWEQPIRNMLPDWLARDYRVMYKFFQDHGMIATERELAKQVNLMGHQPRGFHAFVKEVTLAWRGAQRKAA